MADTIRHLDVCAGLAGFSLGLRLADPRVRTVGYVEREAFCAAVLLARMEDETLERAPVWCGPLEDLDGSELRGEVDLLTAGFPCQPWSGAGKRLGEEDERWIWPDIARLIAAVEPGAVLLENVSPDAFRQPFRDLRDLGFELPPPVRCGAVDVGAPHLRYRWFALAECPGGRLSLPPSGCPPSPDGLRRIPEALAHRDGSRGRLQPRRRDGAGRTEAPDADDDGQALAHRDGWRRGLERVGGLRDGERPARGDHADGCGGEAVGDATSPRRQGRVPQPHQGRNRPFPPSPADEADWRDWHGPQPGIRRGTDGVPSRVDRLRALGNAVMPQVVAAVWTHYLSVARRDSRKTSNQERSPERVKTQASNRPDADPRDERRAPATAVERQIRHIMRDAVPPFGETIPRLVAYVEQFQAQRDDLLAALADVMGHDEVSICAMVHHAKKDQHLAGQPCPVATRYLALLAKHGRRE